MTLTLLSKKRQDCAEAVRQWLDIFETEKAVVLEVEMPGLAKEDISVDLLESNELIIKGKAQAVSIPDGFRAVYQERYARSYEPVIALSNLVSKEGITAVYEHGILNVTIPKAEEAVPKKIAVC